MMQRTLKASKIASLILRLILGTRRVPQRLPDRASNFFLGIDVAEEEIL